MLTKVTIRNFKRFENVSIELGNPVDRGSQPLFDDFFQALKLPNLMRKTDYHVLAGHVPQDLIDSEVGQVLDGILKVCSAASKAE